MTETEVFQALWDAPMSNRGRLTVRLTEVKLRGLDHARTVIRGMNKVRGLGTVLTLHETGSSHWVGRGMERGYSGAATFTVLVEHVEHDPQPGDARSFRYVQLSKHTEVKTSNATRDMNHQHYFRCLQAEDEDDS